MKNPLRPLFEGPLLTPLKGRGGGGRRGARGAINDGSSDVERSTRSTAKPRADLSPLFFFEGLS